jgi:hypothetical protein
MPELIVTRIRRCQYCDREMLCPPLEYEQNPFCTVCLTERIDKATPVGAVRWRREGNYVIAEVARKRLSDAHERQRG